MHVPGLVGDHAPPVKGTVELHDLNRASHCKNKHNMLVSTVQFSQCSDLSTVSPFLSLLRADVKVPYYHTLQH